MKKLLLFLVISCWAVPSYASFAFVNTANAYEITGTQDLVLSLTVTASNMVACVVSWDKGGGVSLSAMQDNGTGGTWVPKISADDNGNGEGNSFVYGYGWSVGPTTITAHMSAGGSPIIGISCDQFSGQASGDPIDGSNFQSLLQGSPTTLTDGAFSGGATYILGKLTPGADNYLVWGGGVNTGALNNSGASEFTAGTNFTENASSEHQVNGDLSFSNEYWIQTTATSANSSWTVTQNTAHVTAMMIFKVAGGGGGSATAKNPMLTGVQ